MKRLLLAVLLMLSCVSAPANAPVPFPRDQVKLILSEDGQCSGIVVAPGLVLSAKHCADLTKPTVDGKPAKVLRVHPSADLMLLAVDVECPCAETLLVRPDTDEQVAIVGFPYGSRLLTNVVTLGRYQGFISADDMPYGPVLILTASAAPGNSGGGAFVLRDGKYRLAGVVVAIAGAGHISLAVDTLTVRDFLAPVYALERRLGMS